MDLTGINLKIQDKNFIEEINDFNTLRKINQIPDFNKVIKFGKHKEFYKKLCLASWESHGDTKLSNKKLAELFKLSDRQVSRIITKLKKLGLISCLHIRGHNGDGIRYNKHGDKSHKNHARKRYWTSRMIRVHWILAVNKYYVKYNLGWKNDFRPKPNLKLDSIKKNDNGSHFSLQIAIGNSIKKLNESKKCIPLKYKANQTIRGQNKKTGQLYEVEPVFGSKIKMIRDKYLWPEFFIEHGHLSALRACFGSHDDPDVKMAIGLLGYTDTYRIKRNFAILKRQQEQAIVV